MGGKRSVGQRVREFASITRSGGDVAANGREWIPAVTVGLHRLLGRGRRNTIFDPAEYL
jgi:hypothetical protein